MGGAVRLDGDSFGAGGQPRALLCRLDPRGRIVAAVLFAVVVVGLSNLAALGLAVVLAAAAMAVARLPLGPTLRKVAAMDGFMVLMLAMLPFTTPGQAVFAIGPLAGSREGLVAALTILLRANAAIMMLLALVGTIEATHLGRALRRLRVPENLVHLLLFTVRYVEVLRQEYARLRTAMKARGFQPATNRHTYRSMGYLLGMLLVRSLDRSERILQAMKCRGFDGRLFLRDDLAFARRDAVFAAVAAAAVLVLHLLEKAPWTA